MKRSPLILLLITAAVLVGCEKRLDTRYLDASLGRSLELPPDLNQAEGDSRFVLPRVFSGDNPDRRDAVPVLARVESLRLQGSGDFYWLEVDARVYELYEKVRGFWANEGYPLIIDEPVIGIMMTDWVFKEEGTGEVSWWRRLFTGSSTAVSQDQFRTRIERIENGLNRVYIVHRGTEFQEEVVTSDRATDAKTPFETDDAYWSFRRSEPELEVEMLSRLMVYLGLQQAEVEQQVADLKMFSPRAFYYVDTEANSPYLIMRDTYHVAWNRVYHQLERMNFDIEQSQFQGDLFGEGFIRIGAEVGTEADAENEESGGFFSWFSNDDDEDQRQQFLLVLSEETHEMTRVEIQNLDGEPDSSREGAAVLDLLFREVR